MKGGWRRVLVEVLKLGDRYQVALLTFIIFILTLLLNLFLCTSAIGNFNRHLHFLSRHISTGFFLDDEHFIRSCLFWACYMQAHWWEKLAFHLIQLFVKFAIFRWLVIVIVLLSLFTIFFLILLTWINAFLLQLWLILRILSRVRLIANTSFIIMWCAVRWRWLLFMKTSVLIAARIITFILTAIDQSWCGG